MMTYAIDGILLVALLFTSLRVGAMYRELKRLRSYQREYVEVFGETSRAADSIGAAVKNLGDEGRSILERLEARIEEARALADLLERSGSARWANAATDDFGSYSPNGSARSSGPDAEAATFRNEILKLADDTRWRELDKDDSAARSGPQSEPSGRDIRMAPSVRTLRRAGSH